MSSRIDDRAADRRWTLALAATVTLAAVLRFAGLQSGLWFDEIVTLVMSVRHTTRDILTQFPGVNTHPLYSLLARGSLVLFGDSAWAIRLPAAIFGVASVLMVYRLGRRLMSRAEAWAASLVLATSYHHVWFSQNARGYTLIGFLALLATWLLLRAIDTERTADYAGYIVACAAGIFTHLTMAFVPAGHAIVLLGGHAVRWKPAMTTRLRPLVWTWIATGAAAVALYAPFGSSLLSILGTGGTRETVTVATPTWAAIEALRSLLDGNEAPAAIVVVVLALVGAVSLWRREPLAFWLLVMPVFATLVGILALHQPVRPRYFFFASGPAVLFAGRGLGALIERSAAASGRVRDAGVVAGAIVVAALSLVALPRNYRVPKQDFEGAVRFLDREEAAGARVVAAGPACWPVEVYYGRAQWTCLNHVEEWRRISAAPQRVLVVYTLADYFADAALRDGLRHDCPTVQRFEGTLGGGAVIVCQAGGGTR